MKYEVKIKQLPKSEVEIEVSLPANFLDSARKKAIEMLSLSLDIPGFRKGHLPENILVERVGEERILDEAVDILLKEHFPKIIEEVKLDILGRPKISVTKLALGNPLELKATFAILPNFELPEYKKIAKEIGEKEKNKEEKIEASEKEIEDVLLQIRKNKAHFDWHKANPDHKEHDHPDLDKEESLPSLTDELAREAGNFKNLEELKNKVKENIELEKKNKEIEKRRALIIEELVKNTKIDLPEILVESEINKSLAQMKDDIVRMKGKPRRQEVGEPTGASAWEDYLSHIKKTEEELKNDLRENSEKKAKIQLIFNKIAETEKIEPNKEIFDNEVKEVLKHYPEANEQNARIYVATILQNSAVLKLLESY